MRVRFFTIPNILTLCNLACGITAAVTVCPAIVSPQGVFDMRIPLLMALCSSLFDFCDGLSARLLGQYSSLGVQLDSLADMVSFGLVPSLVMGAMSRFAGPSVLWAVPCAGIAFCSALRLAKFNIDDTQRTEFEGLATPACSLLVCSLAYWFSVRFGNIPLTQPLLALISLLLSWLLISPLRMFSFKFSGLRLGGVNTFRYILLAAAAVTVAVGGIGLIWTAVVLYVILSILMGAARRKTSEDETSR